MGKTKQLGAAPRTTARQPRQDVAVIIRNSPPKYHWGWFSREDQRMHLQSVDQAHVHLHYKVWLENKGKRVFEAEEGIPAKVLKALEKVVDEERERVEAEWASFMIRNGWLEVRLTGSVITLHAYPKSPNRFERTIEVRELIGNEDYAKKLTQRDVGLNAEFAFLELYPHLREGQRIHESLPRLLWVD